MILQGVVKTGEAGFSRVHALDGLGQLHLVADQDQVLGTAGHGGEIAERHLARLVHEEDVEALLVFRSEVEGRGAHKLISGSHLVGIVDRAEAA